MSWQLTEGALSTIMRGGNVEDPVMQILGSKRIAGAGTCERYRLLVSDGCHLNSFAMLATQLNDMLTSGELSDYSVIRMNRLITSMVNNGGIEKRVMIILDLTILAKGSEVGKKIGNPVAFPEGGSSAAAPTAPPKPAITSPTQSRPQTNGTMGFTPTQPVLTKMELPSPVDGHIFLNACRSPYQNKSVEKEISYIIHDINLEISREIVQLQHETANFLKAYEGSFTDVKKTVDESVQKRNEGLLTLCDNLFSRRDKFLPLIQNRLAGNIQNQLAENVAFAHLVTKQGARNRATVQTFARSHLEALSQLQQSLITHLQKVQEMMEKIQVDP